MNSKSSLAKLAEWSPSDWPESLPEMRTIDNLLRCSICYEFFDVALMIPDCSHNYCSLCIRRSLSYEPQCPTCSLKLNSPTLKNNRVLDELVQNFIKVRTKLLELVTGSGIEKSPSVTAGTVAKEGEEVNKRSKLTSSKRRKDHGRSQRSSKSSSPDTKRQKLDEGKESISNSEETTENNLRTTAESCSKTNTEVIVINAEECCHEQAASEMQPMTVDEDMLEKQTPQKQADSDVAECPVCGDMVPHKRINAHLDTCLTRTEKKSSLRRKTSKEPKTICSTSAKRKHAPRVESKEFEAVSSDDASSSSLDQQPCSSKSRGSSSLAVKGSNALIQTVQKRKPLPKLVYTLMPEKELRQRLKEWNLSTKGDKASLVKRHHDFVLLYNAECDSIKPKSAAQIAREVEKSERIRAKEASSLNEPSTSTGLRFEKNQTEDDMDKVRQKYLKEHEHEFDKLISDVKNRQRGKRKKTAKEIPGSESLSVSKKCEPGEKSAKDENDQSCNTKRDDIDAEKTIANLENGPSSFMANNKVSSVLDQSKSSSFIPEPPSSPSLISLPDEEDELTPSLGLENDDLDCKDEDSRDTNIIPESPVIKVGKAEDANVNTHTAASDSDEEFQLHASVSSKRIKSNLF